MNTFLKTNNLSQDSFNEFVTFFKQIEYWYDYASIPKNIWQGLWMHNLNHFLYTITSPDNLSNEKAIYDHFFTCFKKEAEDFYNQLSETRKKTAFIAVPSITIFAGSWLIFLARVQTDFEPEHLKNSFGAKACLTTAVLLPVTASSIAVGVYLINYFGYKKFLRNIQNINQKGEDCV